MDWLPLIALGVTAFAATNLDDSLMLVLFFGDRSFRARHVFAGQTLGVGLLVLLGLVGALLALALPEWAVGLLGLLPIALGVKRLLERHDRPPEVAGSAVSPASGASGWRRAAAVAGVVLVNGGDNIGVYVPLFATRPPGQTALLLAIFAVMLLVWTFGGYYLARRSPIAAGIRRTAGSIMPWVLIGLGVVILVEAFLWPVLP